MGGKIWYVNTGQEQWGPLSLEEMRSLAAQGRLHMDHYIWREGYNQWIPVSKVRKLFFSRPGNETNSHPAGNQARPSASSPTEACRQASKTAGPASAPEQEPPHDWTSSTWHQGGTANLRPSHSPGNHQATTQFQVTCPHCGSSLFCTQKELGQIHSCPRCRNQIQVFPPVQEREFRPFPPATSSPEAASPPLLTDSLGLEQETSVSRYLQQKRARHQRQWTLVLMSSIGLLLLLLMGVATLLERGESIAENGWRSSRPATIGAADEEFRVAASQKGYRALAAAKALIKLRNNYNWPWEWLENEVDFQFAAIKAEFIQWKQARISAGDRYK